MILVELIIPFGHTILRNTKVGNLLADLIEKNTGIEIRHTTIGHIQRGGLAILFNPKS
jgi:6-phosphofructokinase